LTEDRLAWSDPEEIGTEAIEGRDQVSLRRLRDPENGDHGSDTNGDAEGRKPSAQAPRAQSDAADTQNVSGKQSRGGEFHG
jgi:hypothetical protein